MNSLNAGGLQLVFDENRNEHLVIAKAVKRMLIRRCVQFNFERPAHYLNTIEKYRSPQLIERVIGEVSRFFESNPTWQGTYSHLVKSLGYAGGYGLRTVRIACETLEKDGKVVLSTYKNQGTNVQWVGK